MANSTIISVLKDMVIDEIINDDLIVKVIDSPDIDNPDWDSTCMINTKENINNGFTPLLFRTHQNDNIMEKAVTFICIMVDIPENYYADKTFIKPRLIIYIMSHNDHLRIDNIEGVHDNRNDYLSILLDQKLNGKDVAYGELSLKSNTEGTYSPKFVYREMIFETIDINNSKCGEL